MLIEDVPGVGKTVLARSLSKSLGCSFNRLQFTPDMLPSDVTGVSIFDQSKRVFEFRPGPVFAQIVLVDEINRATPKTQAALLESMEEKQVTVDGVTHPLPDPFMVVATQNPIEYEGTFPLPEAQLDRFLLRVRLGYPSQADEIEILDRQQLRHPIDTLEAVIAIEELRSVMEEIKTVLCFKPGQALSSGSCESNTPKSGCIFGSQPTWQPGFVPHRTGGCSLSGARFCSYRMI